MSRVLIPKFSYLLCTVTTVVLLSSGSPQLFMYPNLFRSFIHSLFVIHENEHSSSAAFTGQEAIWRQVYSSLGLSDAEIDAHFGGVAFLAWARMGNIKGWGGPLTEEWHQRQIMLQKKILKRMHELGMIPVLPGKREH